MYRPTFHQTVDVLVKAYLNDELAHKTCSACAVGNIVAHAIGTKPKRIHNTPIEFDNNSFEDGSPAHGGWYNELYGSLPPFFTRMTGYSKDELILIEKAFENAPGDPLLGGPMYRGRCTNPTWMFNGLMAVVDVLADIHGIDLSAKEEAKKLFVK